MIPQSKTFEINNQKTTISSALLFAKSNDNQPVNIYFSNNENESLILEDVSSKDKHFNSMVKLISCSNVNEPYDALIKSGFPLYCKKILLKNLNINIGLENIISNQIEFINNKGNLIFSTKPNTNFDKTGIEDVSISISNSTMGSVPIPYSYKWINLDISNSTIGEITGIKDATKLKLSVINSTFLKPQHLIDITLSPNEKTPEKISRLEYQAEPHGHNYKQFKAIITNSVANTKLKAENSYKHYNIEIKKSYIGQLFSSSCSTHLKTIETKLDKIKVIHQNQADGDFTIKSNDYNTNILDINTYHKLIVDIKGSEPVNCIKIQRNSREATICHDSKIFIDVPQIKKTLELVQPTIKHVSNIKLPPLKKIPSYKNIFDKNISGPKQLAQNIWNEFIALIGLREVYPNNPDELNKYRIMSNDFLEVRNTKLAGQFRALYSSQNNNGIIAKLYHFFSDSGLSVTARHHNPLGPPLSVFFDPH
ncbi:hypothetical protein OAO18_05800 [Francisellaceae bacterium]|nr:hypothetical protein [Francisellaceae bacterium]